MIYYAKQIDKTGALVALHTMDRPFVQTAAFVPITQAEYEALLAELIEQPEGPTDEIPDSEALAIITGGAV